MDEDESELEEVFLIPSISPDNFLIILLHKTSILSLTYNFFYTSLALAWPCKLLTPIALYASYAGDIFTFLSECSKFFVQYEEEFGLVVKDPARIAIKYSFSDWGLLRLICLIPWELIALSRAWSEGRCTDWEDKTGSTRFDFYILWALIRILKSPFIMVILLRSFNRVKLKFVVNHINRLVKNLLMFILCSHMSACIFWTISVLDTSKNSWVHAHGLLENDAAHGGVSFYTQYLTSLLAAEKALVFYSRKSETDPEVFYALVETLIAALVYGSIFGNIAIIVKNLDSEQTEQDKVKQQKSKVDNIRNYMMAKSFPPELQYKIIAFENHRFSKNQGIDESSIFDDLPKSMRQDVANYMYLDMVSKVSFLQDAEEHFLHSIASAVRPVTVLQGCYIFRQDEYAQEMYFIRTGCVDILNAVGFKLCTLKPGSYFGEIAIIEGCKRTASAFAPVDTELCILRKTDFEQLLDEETHKKLMVTVAAIKERDRQKKIADALAANLPPPHPVTSSAVTIAPLSAVLVAGEPTSTPERENSISSVESPSSGPGRKLAFKKEFSTIKIERRPSTGVSGLLLRRKLSVSGPTKSTSSIQVGAQVPLMESPRQIFEAPLKPSSSSQPHEVSEQLPERNEMEGLGEELEDEEPYIPPPSIISAVKRGSIMVASFFKGPTEAPQAFRIKPTLDFRPEDTPQIDESLDVDGSFEELHQIKQQASTIYGTNLQLQTALKDKGKSISSDFVSLEGDFKVLEQSLFSVKSEITRLDGKSNLLVETIAMLEERLLGIRKLDEGGIDEKDDGMLAPS